MRGIYLISILAVIMLVTGVEQCPMPQGGGLGGGTSSAKSGLDASLVQGVGYLKQGMTIQQGDTFKVLINLANYDKTEKRGIICVKDNQDDSYGGIPLSGECSPFYVAAADYQDEKLANAASQQIALPIQGDYSYYDIPISSSAKIFISYSYVQNSIAQANINVPSPEQETVAMQQPSAPVSVSVEKAVSKQQEQYKLTLGMTLSKQSSQEIKLYSEDMSIENSIKFTAKLSPKKEFAGYPLDCTQNNPGIINIENTKFIKCSALLPLEITSYPLLIYTDYGVKVTKTIDFTISKEKI